MFQFFSTQIMILMNIENDISEQAGIFCKWSILTVITYMMGAPYLRSLQCLGLNKSLSIASIISSCIKIYSSLADILKLCVSKCLLPRRAPKACASGKSLAYVISK